MRFIERKYTINPEVQQNPDVAELASRVKNTTSGWSLDTDYLIDEFLCSDRFMGLSVVERVMAVRAVKACVDGSEWALGTIRDETGLFTVDVPSDRMPTVEADADVLSGALGVAVEGCYAEEYDGASIWDGLGRKGSLDDLKLLGALLVRGSNPTGAGAGFELTQKTQKNVEIYVGADFHGDFGMWRVDSSKTIAYSPGGVKEPFSPMEIKAVRAYHSVEIDIVKASLGHLASEYDNEKLVATIDEILGKIIKPLQAGSHAFGDYGSSDMKVRHAAAEWREDYASNLRQGGVLESLLVAPGNYNLKLQIVSEEKGLHFRQVEETTNSRAVDAEIYIPDENIVDFIAAIASSDQGRVAPEEIIDMLHLIREKAAVSSDA